MKEYIVRVFTAILLLLIFILNILFSDQYDFGIFSQIFGYSIIIIGIVLIIVAKKTLGEFFTTSIIPKGLVTHGIYSKIRHPMFFGAIIVFFGISLIFSSIIGFLLVIFLLIPFFIYSAIEEETILKEKYKERYTKYKKNTFF